MFNNVPLHYLGTVGGKYRDFNILHLQSVLLEKIIKHSSGLVVKGGDS